MKVNELVAAFQARGAEVYRKKVPVKNPSGTKFFSIYFYRVRGPKYHCHWYEVRGKVKRLEVAAQNLPYDPNDVWMPMNKTMKIERVVKSTMSKL